MKVAIIGSGISGLVCAHLLHKKFEIKLFESADYIGGHTNTHLINLGSQTYQIDTGFIVFNKKTYPNFLMLIEKLNVPYQQTAMSFSVKCEDTGLEYNGTSLNSLFAQRKNLFSRRFWRMVTGIIEFNKVAKKFLEEERSELTLTEFLKRAKIKQEVIELYLVPMAAAVWSANPRQMFEFPALFLLRFWENHGFLNVNERPQWYVIKNGSHQYVKQITKDFTPSISLSNAVVKVKRTGDKVEITSKKQANEEFDAVVFACHSDEALRILGDPTPNESRLLKAFPYQKNIAVLHTDSTVLPKSRLAWAAWNYHLSKKANSVATLTYNMNILQSIDFKTIFNVTLNPPFAIDRQKTLKEIVYHHPVFTVAGSLAQQTYLKELGAKNTFLRNGFHEDGVVSALRVCEKFGATL